MFRSPEEWEALEVTAARSLASAREKLPVLGAAAFFLALVMYFGYWSHLLAFFETGH